MSDIGYLETTKDVYKSAAETPDKGLCCTTSPVWQLPELIIPNIMLEMNYGCGTTVHPRDLVNNPNVLYVGVGGGMELLQFAYFSRKPSGVLGVDIVDEMLEASNNNMVEAEILNPWFQSDFIELRKGTALDLPVGTESIDVAAQNCLFNIFKKKDLKTALGEIYRVLKPGGRFVLSDPICESPIPDHLQNDDTLRALCLSGAQPLNEYLKTITDCGFGTIEVRAKRAYRILSQHRYEIEKLIHIESVEICAIKDPVPEDGPCIFTGKTAIYYGDEDYYDDGKGHILFQDQPLSVCDKTSRNLQNLNRSDIYISPSTFFYDGGGCC
jgi:ubiquinone/menaquinone biosynthesis C-methylase UbiE